MSNVSIRPGNTARAFAAFRPGDNAVVDLADVTANIVVPASAVADVTADLVANGRNRFYVDVFVPANGEPGEWAVEFVSNSPSPKITPRRAFWHVEAVECAV